MAFKAKAAGKPSNVRTLEKRGRCFVRFDRPSGGHLIVPVLKRRHAPKTLMLGTSKFTPTKHMSLENAKVTSFGSKYAYLSITVVHAYSGQRLIRFDA